MNNTAVSLSWNSSVSCPCASLVVRARFSLQMVSPFASATVAAAAAGSSVTLPLIATARLSLPAGAVACCCCLFCLCCCCCFCRVCFLCCCCWLVCISGLRCDSPVRVRPRCSPWASYRCSTRLPPTPKLWSCLPHASWRSRPRRYSTHTLAGGFCCVWWLFCFCID